MYIEVSIGIDTKREYGDLVKYMHKISTLGVIN